MSVTIARLQELINETHKHGVALAAQIRQLEAEHKAHNLPRIAVLTIRLHELEALNHHRRIELQKLVEKEHPQPKPKPQPHPAPRFEMFDSTNVGNIPSHAVAVAGYVNGRFANFHQMVANFPHAKHISISINAETPADALDVETGDARPEDAPRWVRARHAEGVKRPIVYANTSTMPQVIALLTADGIKRDEYLVWTAHYTNTPHIEPGSDATQFEDHRELFDVSLCEPYFI